MIRARLLAITDVTVAPPGLLEERIGRLLELARPSAVAIQLRDRQLSARARWQLGRRLLALAEPHSAPLIVNDRLDLALALGAGGVHLGEASVSAADARRLLRDATIFVARHSVDAFDEPAADAVVLAPVLAARHGREALGLAALRVARARLRPETQLYALGGIDADSAAECLAAGADGVAAIGAVLDGRDVSPLLGALGIAR